MYYIIVDGVLYVSLDSLPKNQDLDGDVDVYFFVKR